MKRLVFESSTVPEETVVLHTDLPQPLGRSMILELESHGALKLFRLLLINCRENIKKKKRRKKRRHFTTKQYIVYVVEYKPLQVGS